jgi:hypothetical protein
MKLPLCVLSLALYLAAVALADDPEPSGKKLSRQDIEKAEKAVQAYLTKVRGNQAQVKEIADESVERALPGHAFFSVRFPRFPIARIPPPGLKSSNVFVVGKGGKARPLTTVVAVVALKKLFKDKLPAQTSKVSQENAAHAWVRLSQEFVQDGFYRFRLEKDSTKVKDRKGGGHSATAKVVVMAGGNGTLTAVLNFDKSGKFESVKEESKIKPGPRPICQATKLLDTDPIVRAMAEQALLCMGRAAKPYLDEQRGKASPALKKAIDRIWQRIVETDR